MSWTHFAAFALGMVAIILIVVFLAARLAGWRRLVVHFVLYLIDTLIAMAGFILAFGLTVENWYWLIALPLVSRFAFHSLHQSYYLQQAWEKDAVGKHGEGTRAK